MEETKYPEKSINSEKSKSNGQKATQAVFDDELSDKIAMAIAKAMPKTDPALEAARMAAIGQIVLAGITAMFQGIHGCQNLSNTKELGIAEQHTKRVALVCEHVKELNEHAEKVLRAVSQSDSWEVAHHTANETIQRFGDVAKKMY
jgi:hypothetical protein